MCGGSKLTASWCGKSIPESGSSASNTDPARHSDQCQDRHPDHKRTPDHPHRARHGIHIGIVTQPEVGAKIHCAVLMQGLTQAHTECTGPAREHYALVWIKPFCRLRSPAIHGVLKITGDGKADRGEPHRNPVEIVECPRSKLAEVTVLGRGAQTPLLFKHAAETIKHGTPRPRQDEEPENHAEHMAM